MPSLTLLTATGQVHKTGGLNWGSNPSNHTTPKDAYIPIHIGTIRRNPGLFDPKGARQRVITLRWDDGTIMQALFEGNLPDRNSGVVFPKQISSTPEKNVLGKYFRRRMGLASTAIITLNDLINYGRTDISISRINATTYDVDFHV